VKVNDRGPFVDNRLIDLSYAAATALDMVRSGTARVEVRTVAPPRDGSAAAEVVAAAPAGDRAIDLSPPPTPGGTDLLYVQIGAFSEHDNAERLVARLRASGFANPIVFSEPTDRRRLHRVRLGPIRDSFEFDQLNARLRAIGVSGSQLVVDRGP
jgi:rare lipoprotein A